MAVGSGVGTPISPPAAPASGAVTSGCSGRYAEAWEYGAFWCRGSLGSGEHGGLGPADVVLSDAQADFTALGIKANDGMVLYNITLGTSGPVTAVTALTLTATGVTWNANDEYRIVPLNGTEIATINHFLDVTAADIGIALAAQNACNCTFTAAASAFIKKINIIEAATFHNCSCVALPMDNDVRRMYFEWAQSQLEQLRDGELTVCQGDTGSNYPTIGWAPVAHTEIQAAEIIKNELLRSS